MGVLQWLRQKVWLRWIIHAWKHAPEQAGAYWTQLDVGFWSEQNKRTKNAKELQSGDNQDCILNANGAR